MRINPILADCPTADLSGDCFVDLEDLALMASQWLTGNRVTADMVFVAGGTFQMGDDADDLFTARPVHSVTVNSFEIGKYEITNWQYCQFLNSSLASGGISVSNGIVYGAQNSQPYCETLSAEYGQSSPIEFSGGHFNVPQKDDRTMANDPVLQVSWYGAVAYCNWRSLQEGKQVCYNLVTWQCNYGAAGYRLPTEAEWEYAARGGLSRQRFPWGNLIDYSFANYSGHPIWSGSSPSTSPVGSFPPNGFGLYDMAGNAREWCNDWYSGTYYSTSPQNNPTGPATGTEKVRRGGGWSLEDRYCLVAYRSGDKPHDRYEWDCSGFRVVLPK